MPTIPAIPAQTGGAGRGSFKAEKINPTKSPVPIAAKMVVIAKTSLLFCLSSNTFSFKLPRPVQFYLNTTSL